MAEGNRKEPRYLSINDRIVFDRTGTIYRDGKSLYSGENALIAVLGILVDRAGDIVSPEEIVEKCGIAHLVKYIEACGAEALVLGCTHFPYIKEELSKMTSLPIIDPADEMFEAMREALGV